MTPLPYITDDEHNAMNHRLYMAQFSRETALSYLRRPTIYGKDPWQFHHYMRQAIRWVQVEKHRKVKLNG